MSPTLERNALYIKSVSFFSPLLTEVFFTAIYETLRLKMNLSSETRQSKLSRVPAYLTVQMVRFFYKEKESVNAKVLKVRLQYHSFPRTRDQKNSTRRTRLFVVVCFEGCQVPTYAGCLRAVYRRAPGENAAYQVQVQGDGGQKAGETAAESESCCLSILFAKFSSNFFKNSSQLPTTCIVFVCTLDDEA